MGGRVFAQRGRIFGSLRYVVAFSSKIPVFALKYFMYCVLYELCKVSALNSVVHIYVIDILQASLVTGYTRDSYSIRIRGVAEASN